MMQLENIFVRLVQHYVSLAPHNGRVPKDRAAFVARILDAYMPAHERELAGAFTVAEWMKERDIVAAHLATAVDCVARSQEARWKN